MNELLKREMNERYDKANPDCAGQASGVVLNLVEALRVRLVGLSLRGLLRSISIA